METQKIPLRCPRCEHIFSVTLSVEYENGEEIVHLGMWDDICPACGAQAEITTLPEKK